MRSLATFVVSTLLVGAAAATAASAASPAAAPMRHLVYSFSYGASQSVTVHNSGFGSAGDNQSMMGSGVDSYTNHAGANGTIVVDILREQPDKGLVLHVSENTDNQQRVAKPATCVVWGTGTVICDPNATVNPEEYTIVRFLGENFVDPALIDAKKHWHLGSNGPSFAAASDYTITKNDGGVMQINETRKLTYSGDRSGEANITTDLTYDYNRQVPTAINETTLDHPMVNGKYVDDQIIVTAKLTTDSMQKSGAAASP